MVKSKFFLLGVLVAVVPGVAQVNPPGPTPPPATMPPGTVPIGPPPGGQRGGMDRPSKKDKKKSSQKTIDQTVLMADGVTVENDGKKLVVHVPDGRWLTMTIASDTAWTQSGSPIEPAKVVPRTSVHVEAAEDDQDFLTVLKVELLKDAPAEPNKPVSQAGTQESAQNSDNDSEQALTGSKILHDDDSVPDRPVLRREKPKSLPAAEAVSNPPKGGGAADEQDFTIGTNDAKSARFGGPGSETLERALSWSETFTHGLPNFICEQFTTRYIETTRSDDWHAQDIVSAKIVYEDGHEKYQDIAVGGKKVNKSMMDIGGTTSTGEFASMLSSLMDPGRDTEFKFHRSAAIHDTDFAVFDFKVVLPRSDWRILVGGQMLMPAYSGAIWVDKSTGAIHRLEMAADNIPKDFPFDQVETAVDYDEVSLGTSKFLLPVHSENLACERGTTICSKNTIDFRDYHKYSGESTIVFK
ncbi:MAG: hypothetical protein JO061_09130 [Acidobacteriaceae bacterium]|nr:hypothetical protein [Acidobacteriaceae bacterium]